MPQNLYRISFQITNGITKQVSPYYTNNRVISTLFLNQNRQFSTNKQNKTNNKHSLHVHLQNEENNKSQEINTSIEMTSKEKNDDKISKIFSKLEPYVVDPLPPPNYKWKENFELVGERLNPKIHFNIEPPSHIKDLNFIDVPFPFSKDQMNVNGHLAYTKPFQILSDEGVKLARADIEANMKRLSKSDERYLSILTYLFPVALLAYSLYIYYLHFCFVFFHL